MYNKQLAESRGLSPEIQSLIQNLQDKRQLIKNEMERNQDESESLKKGLLKEFRDNEIELQKAWGFENNAHLRFMEELKISGCNCPFLDNKDARGLQRYTNKTCRWHNLEV